MGWNERGKFGIHCGNTLRRQANNFVGNSRQNLLVKTAKTSLDVGKEDLLSACGLDDGLPDEGVSSFRVGRYPRRTEDVLFSLDKKKRWEKLREIKDWIMSEKEDQETTRVVLVERLVNLGYWHSACVKGDCLGVYDSQNGERKPKRKTAHVGDLLSEDNSERIIYEASVVSAFQRYPNTKQPYTYNVYGGEKAVVKSKGQRKRRYYGNETRQDLNQAAFDSEGCSSLTYMNRNGKIMYKRISDKQRNCQESNVSLVDGSLFETMSTSKSDLNPSCDVSLEELLKNSKRKSSAKKMKLQPSSSGFRPFKPYGKGDAVYLESVGDEISVSQNVPEQFDFLTHSTSWTTTDQPVQLEVESASIQPDVLRKTFGDLYKERIASSKRKFLICVETQNSIISELKNLTGHVYLLCEVRGNVETCKSVLHVRIVSTGSLYSSGVSEAVLKKLESFVVKNNITTLNQVVNEVLEYIKLHLSKQGYNDCNNFTTVKPGPSWLHPLMESDANVLSEEKAMLMIEREMNQECLKTCYTMVEEENASSYHAECGICLNDNTICGEPFSRLEMCNHFFCLPCWEHYLTTCIHQGHTTIHCPAYQCQHVIEDIFIISLLPASLYNKYIELKRKVSFEKDKKFQWCPTNNCSAVAMATSKSICSVSCVCGNSWCFNCQEKIHWPATCKQYSEFCKKSSEYENLLKKNQSDDFYVYVKKCPQCNYPIEKNGGCPHMNCTLCSSSYCWDCLTPFKQMTDFIHTCKKKGTEEINLTTDLDTPKSRFFCQEVFKNFLARKSLHSFQMRSLIQKCEAFQKFYSDCDEHKRKILPCTKSIKSVPVKVFLQSLFILTPLLKKALTFCEQAYLVLEHLAISFSVTNKKHRSQGALNLYTNLKFTVERVESILNGGIANVANKQVQNHLSFLLIEGEKCQQGIKMFARKMKSE